MECSMAVVLAAESGYKKQSCWVMEAAYAKINHRAECYEFWYKLSNQNSCQISPFVASADVDTLFDRRSYGK